MVLLFVVLALLANSAIHAFTTIPPRASDFPVKVPVTTPTPCVSKCGVVLFGNNDEISSTISTAPISKFDGSIKSLLDKGTSLFPLFVLSFSLVGSKYPHALNWFAPYVTPALSLTMLSMGMTLTIDDFKRVIKEPKYILLGFLAQYTIMPLAAYQIAKFAKLGPALSSGLILVGCAPGGTASNLVTLIAQADVALSVVMTACSTMAAVLLTPWLTSRLAGSYVSIRSSDLVLSTLQVVLAPVAMGLLINTKLPRLSTAVSKWTPFLSVLFVSLICGSISSANAGVALGVSGAKLLASIAALHTTGFLLGYLAAKGLGADEAKARTISIETGNNEYLN